MVTVLRSNREAKPSFGQKLSGAVGKGLEMGSQLMQQHEAKQRMQAENQQLQQLTGIDFTGIQDPELRQKAFASAMQAQQTQQEYGQKLSGQKELQQQKYELQSKNPKNAPGGLTGQAIPPEISQGINQIIMQNPNASADELKMQLDQVGVPPIYSNQYVENRRRQDERQAASKDKRLESGQKRAEKILDKADVLGQELPLLESSVQAMEDAIVNGDQSFWSSDNLAEVTGLEFFRTAKGGQFKTAAKTYFLNDLKTSGARPNQFIEKQLVDALTKVGRSKEANQTVLESFKFSNDLKKKWHQTVRDLEKHYDETIGYLPGNLSRIAEEQMKPYIQDRQKTYEDRLKEIAVEEKKNSKKKPEKLSGKMIDVIGPDGQEYEVDQSEVEQLPEGYRII